MEKISLQKVVEVVAADVEAALGVNPVSLESLAIRMQVEGLARNRKLSADVLNKQLVKR